jgi:hypothetical protein
VVDKKLPKAEYRGTLEIGGLKIPCAVLEDGTRVLSEYGITNAILGTRSGASKRLKEKAKKDGALLPLFLAPGQLKPFITKYLDDGPLSHIVYLDEGKEIIGYPAEILPIVCDIWLQARESGKLQKQQLDKAQKAEILARSLAKVGIVALVDEATGYQFDRKHDALKILINAYIEKELQKWVKTFPDSFFVALDNLYKNERTTSRNRPKYYGKFINKYIYNPIERGFIKTELDKLNITDKGKRKARFHQWLTEHGRNQLIMRIGKIEGLLEASPNKRRFEEYVKRLTQPSLFDSLENNELTE